MSFFRKILRSSLFYPFLCALTVVTACIIGDIASHTAAELTAATGTDYIKWVDFTPTAAALRDTAQYDIETYGTEEHITWVELLSYLACKNGGDFSSYSSKDLSKLQKKLQDTAFSDLTASFKLYTYYTEAYGAILSGMIGPYTDEEGRTQYGVIARSPIARGYSYSHYDDFGVSRSFGYRRRHLGHDMMGSIGTPIIAVEGGYVEAVGWNTYGGWRIGIRSFDGQRYYYYAHLRKNHPYNDIYQGKTVQAGEVIGYLGMTGYSSKENTNNISTPHLHYGLQIIFDPSQKDGTNQIWVNMYAITEFLESHTSAVAYNKDAKEYFAISPVTTPNDPD